MAYGNLIAVGLVSGLFCWFAGVIWMRPILTRVALPAADMYESGYEMGYEKGYSDCGRAFISPEGITGALQDRRAPRSRREMPGNIDL